MNAVGGLLAASPIAASFGSSDGLAYPNPKKAKVFRNRTQTQKPRELTTHSESCRLYDRACRALRRLDNRCFPSIQEKARSLQESEKI